MWTYTCAEREILYNTYQEMAIWKSIVTIIKKHEEKIEKEKMIFFFFDFF
jgi:hypothetical protein